VAGVKLALGNLAPPPPPPAERPITVCVVQEGQLQQVDATFDPATGDTMVAGQPFAQAYPATEGYAAGATWFINNEPIRFMNRTYVKFGLTRTVPAEQLTNVGTHEGVPVFADTEAEGAPEVIYLPVRPGCEFQPYPWEEPVRGVRG
jgi:hypothetical protein